MVHRVTDDPDLVDEDPPDVDTDELFADGSDIDTSHDHEADGLIKCPNDCENGTLPSLFMGPPTRCSVCDGSGWV